MFNGIEKPSAEKMPRFLEILSEMSQDCINVCVTKFGELLPLIKEEEKEEEFDKTLEDNLKLARTNAGLRSSSAADEASGGAGSAEAAPSSGVAVTDRATSFVARYGKKGRTPAD